MRSSLIIHPEELSREWIDRAADAGIDVLGIHPKGGKRAPVYVREMMEMMKTRTFRGLIDYARARGIEIEYEIHAASYLLPRALFAEKRELFRMNGQGERTPDLNFCVSNEEAIRIFAENAAKLAAELYGSAESFYFWLDDCRGSACCCEKCRELSPSDQQILAVNAMLREIRKSTPAAKMAYLAYADTIAPPEKVPAEEGVFLEYAPMEKYKEGAEALAEKEEAMLLPLIEFFGRKDAKVLEYWYDNSMFSGWEKPPKRFLPDREQIARDVALYREKGFEYISTFACFLGEDYEKLYGAVDIAPFAECIQENFMYRIGLSTGVSLITEENLAEYRANGITAMEISDNMEGYARLDYARARALAEKYGVEIWSMHLPFSPFTEIDISRPTLAEHSVEYFAELIAKGASIGAKKFVIHPSGEPIKDEERAERMATAKKSLASLAIEAAKYGAVIYVENLPRTCLGKNSEEIAELLSAHPDLRACFDTNHLLCEDPVDFICKIGKKIETLHVSDYDFVNERHWLPGEGKVNWRALIAALREIDYSGVWMYEILFKCPKTILRPRDLTCEDFARNARELFAGEEPTVFSSPKPNLGWWE